jgi:exopolysaccharide biosynthesis polyprenyl glycosylphosphotransferase
VFSRHRRKAIVLFSLADVVLTWLAFESAYQMRSWLQAIAPLKYTLGLEREFYILPPVKALLLGAAITFFVVFGFWLNIYDRLETAYRKVVLRDTFRQCLSAVAAVVLLQYLLRLDLSRPFLAFFALFSWMFLCLFRLSAPSFSGMLRREFGARNYVVVVGVDDRARRLGVSLERSAESGIRLLAFLAEPGDGAPERIALLQREYPVYPLEKLSELTHSHVIDEVIFAVSSEALSRLEEVFLLCDEEGVRTRVAVDFFPHVNSQVYLDRLGEAPLLTFSAAPHDEIRLFLKRMIDVALASAALVLLSPFLALIAVLIRLTSPGPAIFRQVRCGLNGRRFMFYKFRSMCAEAESMKASLAHLNQKQTAFKIPNDPRLTPLGRWLRKFSIDEWPQLWNVLRGDMSLVGPRPAVPEEVERYQRWQRRRLRMRPGLTCLWALAGRDALDFETWMKMDMQYIDTWSLGLDCKIILRTIPNVLSGKGAH